MDSLPESKVCSKCGISKSFDLFHRNRSLPGGYYAICKDCNNARNKGYYHSDIERHRAIFRAAQARQRAKDPQKALDATKRWYDRKGREHHAQYREKNRETYRANARRRYALDPEGHIQETKNRNAMRKGAEGSHTLDEWKVLCSRYNDRCLACSSDGPLTEDHIVPLADGGTDYIHNIQPLCVRCNSRKNRRHLNLRPDRLLPAPV